MDVSDLSLAPKFIEHFEGLGIESLYPPQAAAVEAGITRGDRVVAAMPTASGKTLVAQLAMLSADGPALYVVPLRALATEKYETFSELPDVSVGIATGDYDAENESFDEDDIVVATSEKVDSAIRNGASWVEAIACVVVDEVHLLNARGRGPTLEVTLAKLRRLVPDQQLVALSATVGNAAEIADWLDAELVRSTWRPIDLRTGVYDDGTVTFDDGGRRTIDPGDDPPTTAMVADVIDDGGQALVFVNSRREAETFARSLGAREFRTAPDVATGIREGATTSTGRALAEAAEGGVGFHHAGLRAEHRSIVEQAFRERDLAVLCATPTLAAGVNVPARRVIVRDHERFTGEGYEPLPVLEVHQMFGRAGRPGLDPYGEAMLVATGVDAAELRERYIGAEPERVESKLDSREALRTHVLATLAGGFAENRSELDDLLSSTFFAHQRDPSELTDLVDEVLSYLDATGMVRRNDGLSATDLGRLVSRVYVDPLTGAAVVEALGTAAAMDRVTTLTVLEIICDTEDMSTQYVRTEEAGRLSEFAMRNAEQFTKPVHDFEGNFQSWLATVKTARILDDWIAGVDPADLDERYGVAPGDVRRLAERAEWLLSATEVIAEHLSDGTGTHRPTDPDSDVEYDTVLERLQETRAALLDVTAE
ncbi:DEAD/DEAH box helicase [Natranaeroarchaeum sulfidigenes]|uniref:ATP-dependent DNA helicase Hel308 n=1 Tax=Natranaeroarchaeum sulfidigenes TaxID=2784880 RepID=A0A897ML37_9EURY|nr:DEAD/DEAH box helicase [Natranaeroarchaeum sulfidigenes]QSG01274.1 Replicative superfamily II helicase [Natranaeroarchaeum sulfidigenes]